MAYWANWPEAIPPAQERSSLSPIDMRVARLRVMTPYVIFRFVISKPIARPTFLPVGMVENRIEELV